MARKSPKPKGTTAADDFAKAEADEQSRLAVEASRAAQIEACQNIAIKTLTGDLRDMILNKLRHEQDKRPWDQRSESEQRETIHAVESSIQEHIRRAVELISAGGLPTIKATLDQVVVKEGLKLVLVLDRSNEQRHQIMDAAGGTVLLVVADASQFMGERAPAKVNPDQMDIEHIAGVVHSSDEADDIAEKVANGHAEEDKPGWRPSRDAVPPTPGPLASPLN